MSGKGDKRRPEDAKKFRENYDKIFSKKPKKTRKRKTNE